VCSVRFKPGKAVFGYHFTESVFVVNMFVIKLFSAAVQSLKSVLVCFLVQGFEFKSLFIWDLM